MSKPSYKKLAQLAGGRRKTMKCHYREWSLICAFHYNGLCLRDHNYECPALAMKNLSHGEMVQIAEGKKNKIPRYIDANKLIDLATHEGAYGYVDVHDIYNIPPADVVERKKGFWEYVDDVDYRCSVCHKYAYGCIGEVMSGQYKYCPYCGAAMEVEEDNDNQN